jgi:hypothetical protein
MDIDTSRHLQSSVRVWYTRAAPWLAANVICHLHHELISNMPQCRCSSAAERARRERHLRRQQRQQQQQEQQDARQQPMRLSADPSGGLKGLMQLDMKGMYTAVHVAKSLGQLDTFRCGHGTACWLQWCC